MANGLLKTHLWIQSLPMGFLWRLRRHGGSTWLQKRLEEISLDVCYCLPFFQLLQLPLGLHCQLANIYKCCFLTGTFQDIKNYQTHRYWAAVPRGTNEFIVQCGRNDPYISNRASQGRLSSSRLLRKQVPSGLSVNTIPYSLGVSRDKTALKSSTSLSPSKV